MSMGLSYAPQYTWTEHFVQRAQERFQVSTDLLPKWVGRQIGSLTVYDPSVEQQPEAKKYISDYGVIFVCNTIEQKFITCYEANDILMEGNKVTIHEYNVDSFKEEVGNLARKYYLKDTKEMLLSVESHLYKFQEISQKVMSGRLTRQNYNLIGNLIDEFHAIKSAIRIIETRRSDFKM